MKNNKKPFIVQFLGKKPIAYKELMDLTGFTHDQVKAHIRNARKKGFPIINKAKGEGFYITSSKSAILAQIEFFKTLNKGNNATIKGLRKQLRGADNAD